VAALHRLKAYAQENGTVFVSWIDAVSSGTLTLTVEEIEAISAVALMAKAKTDALNREVQ
jgi:hypothetical protein